MGVVLDHAVVVEALSALAEVFRLHVGAEMHPRRGQPKGSPTAAPRVHGIGPVPGRGGSPSKGLRNGTPVASKCRASRVRIVRP